MENIQDTYYLMKIHRSLWVLDETRICNTVGGNKLRKLQYILKGPRPKGIITMGSYGFPAADIQSEVCARIKIFL
jgi:1-aminocyclopropane-1-carboxylate deaminase/D-cysteine desulfhydrase-like pyridoxal-dependent ACC family enzyme